MSGKLVRMPELAELRAFCAAVDLGSLGKAARLLRVSQPAVSKRLRALEELAGSRLLDRSTQGVTPTAAGERLYEAARSLLLEAEAVERLMVAFDAAEAPVRLACSPTIAEFVLPAILVELESLHERHLSVELSVANSGAARALVLEGRAELGLVAAAPSGAATSGLVETPFWEDEIVVGVPAGHPWADSEEVALEQLVKTPMIMRDPGASSSRVVRATLESLGLSAAPPRAEIGSTSAALDTAVSEGTPVFVSSLAAAGRTDLLVRRARGVRFERRFVIVHSGEEGLPSPARALLRHLADAAQPSRPTVGP